MKNILKHLLFKMPRQITKNFYLLYNYFRFPEYREERKTYGKLNPNIIFYVIRPRPGKVEGLMALLQDVIKQLDYAEKHSYIPIVDFKNYETQYYEENINVWEIYFKQVSEYTLEEVYNSKNVILSGLNALEKAPDYLNQKFDVVSLNKVRDLFNKYIAVSDEVLKLVKEEEQRLDIVNCIGLYMRGTDYIALKPAGHPIQPSVEMSSKIVDDYMANYQIKKVFLVTEDFNFITKLNEKYGDLIKTVCNDVYIKDYDGSNFLGLTNSINKLGERPSRRAMQYLVKLVLLSRCYCIIAGKTCGSWAVCSMASPEKETYIFELGKY